jgi:hypothetical protein
MRSISVKQNQYFSQQISFRLDQIVYDPAFLTAHLYLIKRFAIRAHHFFQDNDFSIIVNRHEGLIHQQFATA